MGSPLGRCVHILAVLAAAVGISGCAEESQLADEDTVRPGRIVRAEGDYGGRVLFDPWIRAIAVGDGATLGSEVTRQVRFGVDGFGPLEARTVTLETPPAVALYDGDGSDRFERQIRGSLRLLDEREGFIRGMSFSTDRPGYAAAALAGVVEEIGLDGTISPRDRRFVTVLLSQYAQELSEHAEAWYDPRTTWITLGPTVSTVMRDRVVAPSKVTPARGIRAAMVIRHEIEHSVTPTGSDEYRRYQWLEEGGADLLAAWPGEAARTAKLLGLPYPKRYERRSYRAPGGYPDWASSVDLLLRAAGVDTSSPDAFSEASELLQGGSLQGAPDRIAGQIASEHGLPPARRAELVRGIVTAAGERGATRQLVAKYL